MSLSPAPASTTPRQSLLSRVLAVLHRDDRRIWAVLAMLAAADAVVLALSDYSIAWRPMAMGLLGPLALGVLGIWYALAGRSPALAAMALALSQLLCLLAAGIPIHQMSMGAARPLIDPVLASADAALGFDWVAYERFVGARAWLHNALGVLYESVGTQVFLAVGLLALLGRFDRLRETVYVLVVGVLIVTLLSALAPAAGAHWFYGVAHDGKAAYLDSLFAVRSGGLRHIDTSTSVGLATFPSFHTAMALILTRAFWGVRRVGPVMAAVNLGVLASVPVFGSHYLADMLGGAFVVACAYALWRIGGAAPRRRAATGPSAAPARLARVGSWWRAAAPEDRAIWGMIAAMAVADALWLSLSDVETRGSIDLRAALLPLASLLVAVAMMIRYGGNRISAIAVAMAQLWAAALVAAPLNYFSVSLGAPLADPLLARIDAVLGFDWVRFATWMAGAGWFEEASRLVYNATATQIFAVAAILGLTNRFRELRAFVGCLVLAGVAGLVVCALLPAVGPHAHYGIPEEGADAASSIAAWNAGEWRTLDLGRLVGLVTFPSFHAVAAVLMVAFTWRIAVVGPLIFATGVFLLFGVPVWGGHYLIDILAGVCLAGTVLTLWRAMFADGEPEPHPGGDEAS